MPPNCYLCKSSKMRQLYTSLSMIWSCDNCGLVFHYPQPDLVFLKKHYGETYFVSRSSVEVGYDNYFRDEENIRRTFQRRLSQIKHYLHQPGRLLDVGCAAGFFLSETQKCGWTSEGIEISEFAAAHALQAGFPVFVGALEEYPENSQPFDLITLWDVFEHFRDPRVALQKIYKLLKPGGYLVMTTPAIDSLPHFFFRDRWMGFKEDEHLYFFSKKTMRDILISCGFEIRSMRFEGKYVSLDLFKRRIGCYWKGLSEYLRKRLPVQQGRSWNFYINPFDIRLIVAQKMPL